MSKATLNQISSHAYWMAPDGNTDRPTLGVIAGTDATLLVDAGNSVAHAELFLEALNKLNVAPAKYLVLTHWHWDHVFGTPAFDIPILAYEETTREVAHMATLDWSDAALDKRVEEGTEIEFCRDMLKVELPDRSDLQFKIPDVSFSKQLEFDLGGVTCLVKHVGGDHASDSVIVHVPEDDVLFLSDCMYPDLHHGPTNYTTKKAFPLIDELLSYDADHYIWGHHDEPMPKAEMQTEVASLKTIGELVDEVGDDKELILKKLEAQLGEAPNEDHIENVDEFIAGLKP